MSEYDALINKLIINTIVIIIMTKDSVKNVVKYLKTLI